MTLRAVLVEDRRHIARECRRGGGRFRCVLRLHLHTAEQDGRRPEQGYGDGSKPGRSSHSDFEMSVASASGGRSFIF
jgi:hypothetical protein